MAVFDIGETVICSVEVKNDAGTLVDPATSMQAEIRRIKPSLLIVVATTAMTKDAVGKYHYDFQTTSNSEGTYIVKYIATDGTRITIDKEQFDLAEENV